MKLKDLINKYFLGTTINKKDLKPKGDYIYIDIDNISENGMSLINNHLFIKNSALSYKYKNSTTDFLDYGDYYLFEMNGQWITNRYQNELNNKILVSSNILVLRPTGNYFDSFLKDVEGRLYFENKINTILKKHNSFTREAIEEILSINIDHTKELIVKKAFSDSKIDVSTLNLKRQPLNPKEILITTERTSIYSIIKRIERNSIDLFTEFQRLQNLWGKGAKSRLIESILVRFPIPSFYFDCSNEEKWLVIDGLQRLSTLYQFYTDSFELEGLEYLKDLEGKKFSQISQTYQSRIEETNITTLKILPGTPLRVKYSLFERINTEGKPLKAQELRHAINSFGGGKPSKFVEELSKLNIFRDIWGDRPKSRMQDREIVLRFLSFKIAGYENYKPELKSFLDENMAKLYELSKEEMNEIKTEFADSLVLASQLFNDTPFRLKSSDNKNIFNAPLFETLTVVLSKLPKDKLEIIHNRKVLATGLLFDLLNRKEFLKVINTDYSNTIDGVIKRYKSIKTLINVILE